LVPKPVTLNDLERRNSRNFCVISPNSVAFGTDYVKVVENTPMFLRQKYRTKNLVFIDISLTAILAEINPSESVEVRHCPLASENLTVTWKRCKKGGKLVLITNRKSYMSFRLVQKSVTLNNLGRRNGSYFALFQPICYICVPTLMTGSSSIEFIDHQESASVTHIAVKLVCVTKFKHSRVK